MGVLATSVLFSLIAIGGQTGQQPDLDWSGNSHREPEQNELASRHVSLWVSTVNSAVHRRAGKQLSWEVRGKTGAIVRGEGARSSVAGSMGPK